MGGSTLGRAGQQAVLSERFGLTREILTSRDIDRCDGALSAFDAAGWRRRELRPSASGASAIVQIRKIIFPHALA
jgi:hypothetical protein